MDSVAAQRSVSDGSSVAKPRKLGRGLSGLLGELGPVSVSPQGGVTGVADGVGGPGGVGPGGVALASAPATPEARSSTAPSVMSAVSAMSTAASAALPAAPLPASGPASTPAAATAPAPVLAGPRLRWVGVDQLVASPYQPRRSFDEAALEQLAASIRSAGVMQPLVARRRTGDERFELIAGERRWRAARRAGLATVPVVLVELADAEAAQWSLIENVQREDLGPMERAHAFRQLAQRFGLSHQQIAEKVGLERSSVTNTLRLTELEPPVQALLEAGTLQGGHGKALLSAPAGMGRVELAQRAAREGWSVRRLEAAAAELAARPDGEADGVGTGTGSGPAGEDPEARLARLTHERRVAELQRRLGQHLGTKVVLKTDRTGTRGRVEVHFFGVDQFQGLLEKLGVPEGM